MPEAFHAMAVLCAKSAEAVERGEFRMLLYGAQGPSGARMLGRFCHVDPEIDEGVRKHLADEEALHPDAIFAEIVHLPAGRIGNVLARPVLRGHEIAFLGRSGAPPDRQIAVQDLMVTVSGDRIRLRSRSLDREIIPRITSAHNTSMESLGVYRFLAAIQPPVGMQWDWGAMDLAPFLPRVTSGRLVLARASAGGRPPRSRPSIAIAALTGIGFDSTKLTSMNVISARVLGARGREIAALGGFDQRAIAPGIDVRRHGNHAASAHRHQRQRHRIVSATAR